MLARELGYTVKDLLESLGDGELDLWYEEHKRRPLGNSWYQTGMICSTVANYAGKISTRNASVEDFVPIYRPPLSPSVLKRKILAAMMGCGVKITNRKSQ